MLVSCLLSVLPITLESEEAAGLGTSSTLPWYMCCSLLENVNTVNGKYLPAKLIPSKGEIASDLHAIKGTTAEEKVP